MLLTDFSYGAPAASASAAVGVFGCGREFPSPCPSLKTHQCRTHCLASRSAARSNALQHYYAFSANSVWNSFIRFFLSTLNGSCMNPGVLLGHKTKDNKKSF